jgi:hypothetical protein
VLNSQSRTGKATRSLSLRLLAASPLASSPPPRLLFASSHLSPPLTSRRLPHPTRLPLAFPRFHAPPVAPS